MRRPWAKQSKEQVAGAVRRSQLITTYGAGALIDLVHTSAMVGGLDAWKYPPGQHREIRERRLSAKLVAELARRGIKLKPGAALRAPPACDDDAPDTNAGIEVIEFPRWMVCPECSAMAQAGPSLTKNKDGRYLHTCARAGVLVPVRFVIVCPAGHIDEFPWVEFVHLERDGSCRSNALTLREDPGAELYDVKVSCQSCRAERSMQQATSLGKWHKCPGSRPWLGRGPDITEKCDAEPSMRVRTSSAAYFAQVVSALSIPDPTAKLEELVRRHMTSLGEADREQVEGMLRYTPPLKRDLGGYPVDEVWNMLEAIRRGETPPEPPLRDSEARQLLAAPFEQAGDDRSEDERAAHFYARRMVPDRHRPLPPGIERVVLVRELREVRAQVGFTRLAPIDANLEGELDGSVKVAALGHMTDWLPAIEDRGEGLWIHLDPAAVAAWEGRDAVVARARKLETAWRQEFRDRPELPFFGARFYMLHALSHLLIQAISLECGYGASSIRERLYCSPPGVSGGVAAILLSTTTPGSDGTLGGLVAEGRRIGEHLETALRLGLLCSSDPVCATHDPAHDHAERHLEGAACHGCLYLAEVSCERMNRMLDRALVVPIIDQPDELAFFAAPAGSGPA